jgi:biotin operon repressor
MNDDDNNKMPKRSTNASYMSLEEIADIMGITRERVRQIEQKALFKLRKRLRAKGIKPEDLLGGMQDLPHKRTGGVRPED